jgi:hypothetical protein
MNLDLRTCRYDVMNILCDIPFYEDVVLWNHKRIVWKKELAVYNWYSALRYKLMLIMKLGQECKLMSMSIWSNVSVWLWKYNIVGMCIDLSSYENVDLGKLCRYDVMIRKGT